MRKTTTKTADKTLVTPKKRETAPLTLNKLLLTIEEASQLLNIGRKKIHTLVTGPHPVIGSIVNGNKRLIPRAALEQFIEDIVTQKVRQI